VGTLKDVSDSPFETTIVDIPAVHFKAMISPNNFMLLKIRMDSVGDPASGLPDDSLSRRLKLRMQPLRHFMYRELGLYAFNSCPCPIFNWYSRRRHNFELDISLAIALFGIDPDGQFRFKETRQIPKLDFCQ
jgi:hypothetical protein